MTTSTQMVTAVCRFIEQVGFQNTIFINPLIISLSFKELAQTYTQQVNLYKFIGNYPVQNQIITSRWMHMSWLVDKCLC